MARQYKHGIAEVCLELPGGLVEHDEEPQATAERELREEVGYACDSLLRIASLIHAPSKDTNRVHGFIGFGAHKTRTRQQDISEQIKVEAVPISDVEELIRNGEISASDTVAFLMLALIAPRARSALE